MMWLLKPSICIVARPLTARGIGSRMQSSSTWAHPSSLDGRAHTIIGAGTLGRRIAMMWLTRGGTVHLFDSNRKALDAANDFISSNINKTISSHVPDGTPGNLKLFDDRAKALETSFLVTECIPEIQKAKIDLLGELDKTLPPDVIIATNSSSYTGSEVFEKVTRKDRFVNMHYYMPPEARSIEVMPTSHTNEHIAPFLLEQCRRHGLTPYHVRKESVGLIANRIWAAIKRESLFVISEGVSTPEEVNELLKNAFGVAVIDLMDKIGLDVSRDIELHYQAVRPDLKRTEASDLLTSYVDQGKLGVKSGEGFFKYPAIGEKTTAKAEERKILYIEGAKGLIKQIRPSGEDHVTLFDTKTSIPDGIQVDPSTGKVYWTSMGRIGFDDGRICVTDLHTGNFEVRDLVPPGSTHTPKQTHLDMKGGKLYWCDREGGRIQRCNTDGTALETLYDSAPGETRPLADAKKWCVGITFDSVKGLVYWTQKGPSKGGQGRIFRAHVDNMTSIQTLLHHLPEPIDVELDPTGSILYYTDRGDPPFGNTLNKLNVAQPFDAAQEPGTPGKHLIVAERIHEAIGLAGDYDKGVIYVSDILGSLWEVDLKTGARRNILADVGNFTGITLA